MKSPENRKEIMDLYKQGPDILDEALKGLSDDELDYAPSKGGWTIRQIVHHLADGDDLWKIGVKMALGNKQDEFTLKWYAELTQEEWTKRWGYEKRSVDASITLLKAIREHMLQMLESIDDPWDMAVRFQNADGGIEIVPIGYILKMQADHVVHHVNRIKSICKEFNVTK